MLDLPTALTPDEITAALMDLPGWSGDERGLERRLVFEEFAGAMRFMQLCVEGIESRNHHPVWKNKYNSLEIHLDTFDIGNRTSRKDVDLAAFFNEMLEKHGDEVGVVMPV